MDNEKLELIQEQSYETIKQIIKGKLNSVAESFVSIGYRLKQIRDGEMYKADGYKDIWEFAEKEYSLSQSSTSRFISINDRYSIDGNSMYLLPNYSGCGWSKLSEMLSLTDEELKLVSDKTTRVEIREIKKMHSEADENEAYAHAHKTAESLDITQSEEGFSEEKKFIIPDADKLLIEFFRPKEKRQILKDLAKLLSKKQINKDTVSKAAEIINPSGHLMYRKGMIVIMFEEDIIKYNRFGGQTSEFKYYDFLSDMSMIFDMSLPDPWVGFYGESEPEPVPEHPKKTEPMKIEKPSPSSKDKPAPKSPEKKTLKEIEDEDQDEEDEEEQNEAIEEATDQITSDGPLSENEPWQQDQEVRQETAVTDNLDEHVEVVEADIVHTPKAESVILEHEDGSKELQVLISNTEGLKLIRVIDSDTGESWELTIN